MMKNRYQKKPNVELIMGPQHYHPPDKRKHLIFQNKYVNNS